jgi:hypothetical protein
MGISLACTSTSQCTGGQVCCGHLRGGEAGAPGASCEAACAPGSGQLCTTDNDCPMGDHCSMRGVIHFCRPNDAGVRFDSGGSSSGGDSGGDDGGGSSGGDSGGDDAATD